jgi:hypothetical protein
LTVCLRGGKKSDASSPKANTYDIEGTLDDSAAGKKKE